MTMDKKCSRNKFTLLSDGNNLVSWMSTNLDSQNVNLDEKIIVVSIIGKSFKGSNGCKGHLFDEAIERSVFSPRFGEELTADGSLGCEIEGYFDNDNRVVFLHMTSVMDSDVLERLSNVPSHDAINVHNQVPGGAGHRPSSGFLNLYIESQVETAKCLLFLFSISHIVIVSTPSVHFDTSFLSLFKIVDSGREQFKDMITDALKSVDGLSFDWIDNGRPCSPRVLFTFDPYRCEAWSPPSFGSSRRQPSSQWLIDDMISNRRKYELKLEDQIYRFMRRCRIITNICGNSLFAICNQMDFVYLNTPTKSSSSRLTTTSTIKDHQSYLDDVLFDYCKINDGNGSSSSFSGRRFSTISDGCGHQNRNEQQDGDHQDYGDHTFYNFLFNHINIAQTKGFDDNVGRHNVVPVFEVPTLRQLFDVVIKLRSVIFDNERQCQDYNQCPPEGGEQVMNEDGKKKKIDCPSSELLRKHFRTQFEMESSKFVDYPPSSRSKVIVY